MFTIFTNTLLAQAQWTNPLSKKLSPSYTQGPTAFSNFISVVLGWFFVAGILIFILFFLINAFKYITSQGEKAALESARMGLLHAAVGLVILFGLFALLRVIETTFGVCTINIPIPIIGETNTQVCGPVGNTSVSPETPGR